METLNLNLRQLHNSLLNCTNKHDFFCTLIDLGVKPIIAASVSNDFKKIDRDNVTVLPIYYLQASKATNKKQDRYGNFI